MNNNEVQYRLRVKSVLLEMEARVQNLQYLGPGRDTLTALHRTERILNEIKALILDH